MTPPRTKVERTKTARTKTARTATGRMATGAVQAVRRVPALPARRPDAHKGDFGTVLIVAGSHGMLGAAVLAATAALRSGAGLVRVALPRPLQPLLPLAVPPATTVSRDVGTLRRELRAVDAVVIGPGLGATSATRELVRIVLQHAEVPVVLDADALNVLAPLRRPPRTAAPLVATPHPGEAARLLGRVRVAVEDRAAALAELCARLGGVVALKGRHTLVGDGARCFENRTGNAGMATGGSGDVLSGCLGALLARGLVPFDATCLAVHLHGRAGDRVREQRGVEGLIASDLPLAIAEELA